MRGDSPRGGEMSQSDRGDRALFALDAKRTEGCFLTTNPKNIRSKAQQNVLSERHMSQTLGTFYHVLPPHKIAVGRCARRRVSEANRTTGSALRLEMGALTPPCRNINLLLQT